MFNINRLSVGQRLACGFGTLLLLGLAIAALGAWGLAQTNASLQSIYMQRTVPLKALASMRYLATRDRVLLMDALLHAKADVVTKRVQQYRDNRTASAAAWKLFGVERLDPAERKLADEMARTLAALVDTGFEPMAAALSAGSFDAAKAALEQKVSPLNPAFIDTMDRLMAWQVKESAQTFDSSQSLAQNVTIAMAVLGALGLVAGVAGAVLITRSLVRALGAEPDALAAVAERIADGDLADRGAAAARPGSVMASMQNMRQALVRVVGSVRSGVDGVATASAQIADGNQDLSTRTEQQASSLQQTASSMEQLTGTIGTSAENARQASVLAQGASEVAARGGSLVTQVVQTMGEIQAASRKIGDIIGVIDSIAFQTNILALNAAVEAARAGEQGRGFAVVASEVRSLAQRSAEAARQIKSLIGDSVQRVDSGGVLVQSAGQTMDEIVAQVRRVSDLIGEITSAAAEQSLGINQVGEAVSQLDRTTQQNAALVEQSAAAADSLKVQAARLAQAVAVFRLAPAGA